MENLEPSRFRSPEAKQVTERTYEQYLDFLSLDEENLRGKTIVDIGSGFSSFVQEVNTRLGAEGTRAIGLDPVYAFFDDDFDRFTSSLEQAGLFLELGYGHKPGQGLSSLEEWRQARKKFYQDFREQAQASGAYIAGSHQALPFRDESIDVILASNSLTLFKDREITRRGLEETIRVLKKDGEARLLPLNLCWDEKTTQVYLCKTGEVTEADMREIEKTGKFVDPELMAILKQAEASGGKFYTVGSEVPSKDTEGKTRIVFGNIILRKDDQIPVVNVAAEDFSQLRQVHFINSEDGYYLPSEVVG